MKLLLLITQLEVVDKVNISELNLGLDLSNDLTNFDLLSALNTKLNLTLTKDKDVTIGITKAKVGKTGSVVITAKEKFILITVTQTLEIPAL